jgi:hypothetical protein
MASKFNLGFKKKIAGGMSYIDEMKDTYSLLWLKSTISTLPHKIVLAHCKCIVWCSLIAVMRAVAEIYLKSELVIIQFPACSTILYR